MRDLSVDPILKFADNYEAIHSPILVPTETPTFGDSAIW